MRSIILYHRQLSRKGKIAFWFLSFVLMLALFAPFIAGDHSFSPVAYKPYTFDYANSNYVSPLEEQFESVNGERKMLDMRRWHWLGTNKLGEDVLSGIIHGSRVSITIGFFSTLIALIIGVFIGLLAGYFGDDRIFLKRGELIFLLLGLIPAVFYSFIVRGNIIGDAHEFSTFLFLLQVLISIFIFVLIMGLFKVTGKFISGGKFLSANISFPLDHLLMRFTEVVMSLPALILILAFAAVAKPSAFNLVMIIGFIAWADVARIVRGETLKAKNLGYAESAKALGFGHSKIIFRHILPNILPALTSLALMIFASAILAEASLSFLGIGMPYQTVTWGTLISSAREEISAWWLIVFPGLMLSGTLLSLHTLKEETAAK